jgi:hypothetical protein
MSEVDTRKALRPDLWRDPRWWRWMEFDGFQGAGVNPSQR